LSIEPVNLEGNMSELRPRQDEHDNDDRRKIYEGVHSQNCIENPTSPASRETGDGRSQVTLLMETKDYGV